MLIIAIVVAILGGLWLWRTRRPRHTDDYIVTPDAWMYVGLETRRGDKAYAEMMAAMRPRQHWHDLLPSALKRED